jgi:hypothetical protein
LIYEINDSICVVIVAVAAAEAAVTVAVAVVFNDMESDMEIMYTYLNTCTAIYVSTCNTKISYIHIDMKLFLNFMGV